MSDIPVIQEKIEFMMVSEKNESICQATLHPTKTYGYWLTDVWVHHDYRKRGYANALLTHILERYGHDDIWLRVVPYTNSPMNIDQLTSWYKTFAFERCPGPGIMCRKGQLLSERTPKREQDSTTD